MCEIFCLDINNVEITNVVCYNHTSEKEVTASVIALRKFCARPQYSRSGVASQQILSRASTLHR